MNYQRLLSQFKLPLTILLLFLLSFTFAMPVVAGDQEDLKAVQKKLAQIRKEQQDLKSEISSKKEVSNKYSTEIVNLNNEIRTLQLSVEEKQLVIDELDLKIAILEEQIQETEEKIEQTELEIFDLQAETDKRLSDMYLDIKSFDNSVNMIFASEGSSDFIKDGLYREAMQQDTNEKLKVLEKKKISLEQDKEQLKQDRIQVETDKSLMEEEKKALEGNQTILSQKRNKYESLKRNADTAAEALAIEYKNLNNEEAKLLAEQELIMQRLFEKIEDIGSGTYVVAGTIIGSQGCTGLCTGPHLHFAVIKNNSYMNPCSAIPPISALNGVACGTSKPIVPQLPMHGSYDYTSGYGPRDFGGYTKFHYAIDLANVVSNAPIYAAHDGWLYKGFEPCDPNYWLCKGGGANYIKICQDKGCNGNGIKTLYYHLR